MHKTHIQKLADYIKKNLKKGYTIDSLRFSLIDQDYTKISVENAIELANKQLAYEIPSMKERPEIIYKVIEESIEEENNLITNETTNPSETEIKSENTENNQDEINQEIIKYDSKKSFLEKLFG